MSTKDLTRVVERATRDEKFLHQLNKSPNAALSGYDLTADERAALISGDGAKLEALGVDARITKGQVWN